ncbi:hypothetical protein F511_20721 [Dorcoceras hygrometricum]|uniref:Uncharacterized protein n=1 Tax=Dorcoceras hygrometricum TaxID=472368 RepID=A0A2Z7AZ09_9LAMI|nr:hypothetical protein F511_20721 [Dorcoceras hygrometricum]
MCILKTSLKESTQLATKSCLGWYQLRAAALLADHAIWFVITQAAIAHVLKRKDPLEDLITTASAAPQSDSPQAARTPSHQCTPARRLTQPATKLRLGWYQLRAAALRADRTIWFAITQAAISHVLERCYVMQKAVNDKHICLWKFGAKSLTSPLLSRRKDPLEDLITTASVATRFDNPQAARTPSHQCTPARRLASAYTWALNQFTHKLPSSVKTCD